MRFKSIASVIILSLLVVGLTFSASAEKHKNVIVVNYADRAPGEPFTTQPSVGKSIWLKLDPQSRQWGTVEQNFEGEAN